MTALFIPERQYGHYELERALGKGAMGVVYLARDTRIGRMVALKTIHIPDQEFEDETEATRFYHRLQREAEVCGSLLHPNIVTLYEAGYENERISYMAMELVEGDTLASMIKGARPGTMDVGAALRIAEDVLKGLTYAHSKEIIHRDIKPANVLVSSDGTAKIADFGIARPQKSSLTGEGALIGTPNYMSPEQILGQPLSSSADVFSVGVTLFEMLTGARPFAAENMTVVLHNILRQPALNVSDINPEVPRAVGKFVARLLEKAPADRPTSAEALAELAELRDSVIGQPSPAASLSPKERHPLVRAVPPVVAWIAISVVALTLGILLLLASRTHIFIPTPITPAQLHEFQAKRHALDDAEALYDAGKYQESLRAYETYLQKYPHSTVAQDGRDRSKQALDKAARKAAAASQKKKDNRDIPASELLRRLKRVFHK